MSNLYPIVFLLLARPAIATLIYEGETTLHGNFKIDSVGMPQHGGGWDATSMSHSFYLEDRTATTIISHRLTEEIHFQGIATQFVSNHLVPIGGGAFKPVQLTTTLTINPAVWSLPNPLEFAVDFSTGVIDELKPNQGPGVPHTVSEPLLLTGSYTTSGPTQTVSGLLNIWFGKMDVFGHLYDPNGLPSSVELLATTRPAIQPIFPTTHVNVGTVDNVDYAFDMDAEPFTFNDGFVLFVTEPSTGAAMVLFPLAVLSKGRHRRRRFILMKIKNRPAAVVAE